MPYKLSFVSIFSSGSYLVQWSGIVLASGEEPFSNYGTGPCEQRFYEIIFNLSHPLETRYHDSKIYLLLLLLLLALYASCSVEWNCFSNFGPAS